MGSRLQLPGFTVSVVPTVSAPFTCGRSRSAGAAYGASPPAVATAAAASSSPPLTDRPASWGAWSTLARRSYLSWPAESDGLRDRISASVPETIGVAIEVPSS